MTHLAKIVVFTALALAALMITAGILVIARRARSDESPTVTVEAVYRGATASEVEKSVAALIEQQVNGVEHLRRLRSHCRGDGSYRLEATFATGTELNTAQLLVQNRVALAVPVLPIEIQTLGVTVRKGSPGVLMIVCLRSPDGRFDNRYLYTYATSQLKDELARLPGVAELTVIGEQADSAEAGFASLDGKPAAMLVVYPLPRARPLDVSAAVEAKLRECRPSFPEGLDALAAVDVSRRTSTETTGCLLVDLNLPDGASKELIARLLDRCEQFLQRLPEVRHVLTISEQPFDRDRQQPCIVVCLNPPTGAPADRERLIHKIRTGLSAGETAAVRVLDVSRPAQSPRFGYPIEFAIVGHDRLRVDVLATQVVERMSQDRRFTDLWVAQRRARKLSVEIDQVKAAALGLVPAEISATVRQVVGPMLTVTLTRSGQTSPVQIHGDADPRVPIDALERLKLRTDKGQMVPLSAVCNVGWIDEPTHLERIDLSPAVSITASPTGGLSLAEARFVCERLAAEVLPKQQPAEYRLVWLREMPPAQVPAVP